MPFLLCRTLFFSCTSFNDIKPPTKPQEKIFQLIKNYFLFKRSYKLIIMPGFQLSRGEICVANFIPFVNSVSLGSYFMGVCGFFLSVKFASSLLTLLAGV